MLLSLSVIACKKVNDSQQNDGSDDVPYIDGNTVLGEKINNPYTIPNMQAAFKALGYADRADKLEPNRIYVKLKPQTREDVYAFLEEENENRIISEYPVDRQVKTYGAIYVDEEAKDTLVKPYYCVAKSKNDLPSVPYEILEWGYVPTDAEEDVERKAFEMAGYKIDNTEVSEAKIDGTESTEVYTKSSGFYPNGYLEVYRNNNNTYPAVRWKSIMATTLFKWSYMRTDGNGYFSSSVKFLVPALFYIRYWNQEYKIYGHSLNDHLGSVKKSNRGKHWQIGFSKRGAWHKASLNNTFHDYNNFIAYGGPGQPMINDVTFWFPLVHSGGGAGTVLMRKFHFSVGEISSAYLAVAGNDFNINRWTKLDYDKLRTIMFHEFSHCTHALIAGRSYWKDVCKGEAQNIMSTLTSTQDPYRDGTKPSTAIAAKFGFTEAWAEAMSCVISDYYGISINNTASSAIEVFYPKAVPYPGNGYFNYNSWYPIGLFWDLYDKNNEFYQATVYKGITTPDCFTRPLPELYNNLQGCQTVLDYKANALSKIPKEERKCMMELFFGYGY